MNFEDCAPLIGHGYLVVPIPPGSKAPAEQQWQKLRIKAGLERWRGQGVGFLCGVGPHPLVGLDIDVTDAALAAALVELAETMLGPALVRVGAAPKALLVYQAAEAGWPKVATAWWMRADTEVPKVKALNDHSVDLPTMTSVTTIHRWRVEALGAGQQFVAYGVHPGTGRPYEWTDIYGGAECMPAAELTTVTREGLRAYLMAAEETAQRHGCDAGPRTHGDLNAHTTGGTEGGGGTADPLLAYEPPVGVSIAEARDALAVLDASDYDLWLRVGMALHHEGGGGPGEWFQLWEDWSTGAPNYTGTADLVQRWKGFGRNGRHPVTMRTVLKLAADARGAQRADGGATDVVEPTRAALSEFEAYLPEHKYIYLPTGALWPAESVNASVSPWPKGGSGKDQAPAKWLDAHRPLVQMTWAPGEPGIIEGRLVDAGGWSAHAGARVFNQYKPPGVLAGDAREAGRWRDHLRRVYPEAGTAEHIERWFAQRLQAPQVKINHALVLGGGQGVGKDTLCEPLKRGVGPWNWSEISPSQLVGAFNPWRKSVVVRLSEIHDLGETNRFAFYEATKTLAAAPPDVLSVNDKFRSEYSVLNVLGLLMTTNYKLDGIYLPPDDRRHFVAWSEFDKGELDEGFWAEFWAWLDAGGIGAVVAFLRGLSLAGWDAKAPPPQTEAWHQIVGVGTAPESAELDDAIDALGRPAVLTLDALRDSVVLSTDSSLGADLGDIRKRRQWVHRMDQAGYEPLRNPQVRDQLWVIGKKRQVIYMRKNLPNSEKMRLLNGEAVKILSKGA